MFKLFFSILFICQQISAFAQLQNPSFEQTDTTGRLFGWHVNKGNLTKLSAITFGAIPFTAFEGNYFALLESDTLHNPIKNGVIEQSFAFTDTPKSITLHNLYIPENTSQHARMQLLFTKWNGTSRDTLLFLNDTFPIIAEGTSIPIRWNNYSQTLASYYRNQQLPDSAFIRLTNDDTQTGKTIKWYIDAISFGKWPVGLIETQKLIVSFFPNPAHNRLTLQTATTERLSICLRTLSGQEKTVPVLEEQPGKYELNTEDLASGVYILQLTSRSAISHQLITIQH